jgi:SAM-dependent methyltransferase
MLLYTTLASWYPLLTPLENYEEEATTFRKILLDALGERPPGHRWSLLELGAGAGHNAHFFQGDFDLVLTDLSPDMLRLAARSCPGARLVPGDMRSLRLETTFDAVFVHDAVSYLRRPEELDAMLTTAAAHLRPGGVLVVAPDYVAETFAPEYEEDSVDEGERSFRYHAWVNPADDEGYSVDYVYITRVGNQPPQVHQERHLEGLFSRSSWEQALRRAGFSRLPPQHWRHAEVDRDLDLFVARHQGK